MKLIGEKSIVYISGDPLEDVFRLSIPINLKCNFEINLAGELAQFKNSNLDTNKDSKLWNEVYSPKKELEIFSNILEENLKKNQKIHISNISLFEEIELVKHIYLDLGYFNKELNKFEIDFKNAPITIGVNINNIIYSFKDYKSNGDKIFFIPPPREPRHQKAIKSGINAGIISTISLNSKNGEDIFLTEIIKEEKINLINLANNIFYNFEKIGFEFEVEEIFLNI